MSHYTFDPLNPYSPTYAKLANKIFQKKYIDPKIIDPFDIDSSFREASHILIEDINSHNQLTPFGSFLTKQMLLDVARNCQLIKIHNQTPMQKDPIFILGLPRTGTTFLFNLLSQDHQFKKLRFQTATNLNQKRSSLLRSLKAKLSLKILDTMSRDFKKVHDMNFFDPVECTLLLFNTFKSQAFSMMYSLPKYVKWLEQVRLFDTYQAHKVQLEMLSCQTDGVQWLLKSPLHIQDFDSLIRTYPQAKIIHLHRNPSEVIASVCSLILGLRQIYSHKVDPREIGRTTLENLSRQIKETELLKKKLNSQSIIDLNYKTFIEKPMSTIEDLYQKLNLKLDDSTGKRFSYALKNFSRNKYGKHHYSLEQFSLDRTDIEQEFRL